MNKLLIICGPTATGKTSLGICLAKKFSSKRRAASGWGGEIVSADSRQIYRGMDVGTGKDLPGNAKLKIKNAKLKLKIRNGQILKPYRFDGIPVWLLDVVNPEQEFSVVHYIELARAVIKDIWRRRKLPIVVGGTGFYIQGLIEGVGTIGIEPDWKLRRKLQSNKVSELQREIKELDLKRWERMNESERKNPRRLIRAIEVAKGKQHTTYNIQHREKSWNVLMIGLMAPNEVLYQRIDKRVDQRVKQGIEKEIKQLLRKGYDWENSALGTTLGYKEWRPLFRGAELKKEIIQRWKFNEHGYTRRQMTWFKKALRQAQGKWFDINEQGWQNKVEKLVKAWYSQR